MQHKKYNFYIFFLTTILIITILNSTAMNPSPHNITYKFLPITHSMKAYSGVHGLSIKKSNGMILKTMSENVNYNSSSLGYGWRTKDIVFNGTYYKENYSDSVKDWVFYSEKGILKAMGHITKIISDPLERNIVHVFFVNLTEQEIKDCTVLEVRHFIINVTNQQVCGAYVLYVHHNNTEGNFISFAEFIVFNISTNITIAYTVFAESGQYKNVTGYIRTFDTTLFWNQQNLDKTWTKQKRFFSIGGSNEEDVRFFKDFSHFTNGTCDFFLAFYSYQNYTSSKTEYRVVVIITKSPWTSCTIDLYDPRILGASASDTTRISNPFVKGKDAYFLITLLKDGKEMIYELLYNTTTHDFTQTGYLIFRAAIEKQIRLPANAFLGKLRLFIHPQRDELVAIVAFSETESIVILVNSTGDAKQIDSGQTSDPEFINNSLTKVQLFYLSTIGGARNIKRANVTTENITEIETCTDETYIQSYDLVLMDSSIYISFIATKTENGTTVLVGKLGYGYYDSDYDNVGDIEEIRIGTDPMNPDSDGDGINDGGEELITMTDPTLFDTDGDGIDDGSELLKYNTDPNNIDSDYDGLNDSVEISVYHTDPLKNDTDSDGLTDYEEVVTYKQYGVNPLYSDVDNDNLTDFDEIQYGTYGNKSDSDEDGLSDWQEIRVYLTSPTEPDTDGDGLSDYDETKNSNIVKFGVNPRDNDTDDDGLNDKYEVLYGTLANNPDTDKDGLTDYEEVVKYNTNATDNDTDDDGLNDFIEVKIYYTNPHSIDTDGDNITDYSEIIIFSTNPTEPDTDGDGLSDYDEIFNSTVCSFGVDPLKFDTDDDGLDDKTEVILGLMANNSDTDGDGLTDWEELYDPRIAIFGTDPHLYDTDMDMLNDFEEVKIWKTFANDSDTDNDGISDGDEVYIYNTNPRSIDTDLDGLNDTYEIALGSNPTSPDTDDDGLKDGEEILFGCNVSDNDTDHDGLTDYVEVYLFSTNPSNNDTDGDGLSDYDEIYEYHTNPKLPDTDGDGMIDSEEIKYGTDPLVSDTDGDGLSDGFEVSIGTNPMNGDSDGDGIRDGDEILMGSNPLLSDTDRDFFPDKYDPLPATNNFIIIALIFGLFGIIRAWSYGYFRDWKKDIIAIGLSNIGGTHMFAVPEDFEKEKPAEMFSSAFSGVHMITSELVGPRNLMVMKDSVSIILRQGKFTRIWILAKKVRPRLIKNISKFHDILEKRYSDILALPVMTSEDLKPIKGEVIRFLQK